MKKNLLKSLLLTLMVLVGGSAWAGDKTVVKYSFDDATSPELTAGSRVSFDYSKTSVITSTKFLNAYNNTNGDPGASTLSLGSTDLSGETWTLSFEWAACGGCNSKPDHTTLKAGDTNLFDLNGNSNWNTTVTLSYTGSDGTKTLPVPGCNKSYRFTAAVGNQFNTTDYWHHIVVTGSASGVKLTITNSSTGTAVVEDVVLSETNVSPTSLILEPCCGGGIGIDELSLTYYVEGDVIQTPVANYTAVNGIERTITATCETEGATLYYSTDGENWTEGASVTVSASGNVYFKAVKGTSESDVLTFAAEAGEAITLNAPAIVRSDNTTVTITADQANLLLSPSATIKYTYDDENGEFTGSKTLKVAADATITAYAEATGYTTSATSERAVALFPTYIKTTENTPTKTSGNTTIALSTDIINVSGREYAAVLLDDVQWGTNVYLQNLTLADPIVWGIRNGNWYVNTLEPQWILVRNLKAGDIVVLDITYAASDMVNATYSEKYSFGNKHAYIVTADGDAEFAVKKPSATEMDYLYGVYTYTAMSEAEIALIQAKAALQSVIDATKTIDTTDKQGATELAAAITTAETALAAADATVESLGAAKTALEEAVDAFNKANRPDLSTIIANADFSSDEAITTKICTYAKDVKEGEVANMQPLTGWTIVENGDARAAGVFAYGSTAILGGDGGNVPAAGPNGETEGKVLGIEAVWSATTQYTQDITLPAGDYLFEAAVYNAAGTGALASNLIGIDGTYSTTKNYPVGKWTKDQVKITLTEEKTVTVSIGVNSGNVGNAAAPHLFIDYVKLYGSDEIAAIELAAAKENALAEVNALPVGDALFLYAETAIGTAKNSIEAATTIEEVNAALATAKASMTKPAAEKEYVITNKTAELVLSIGNEAVKIAKEGIVKFTEVEGGWVLSNNAETPEYVFKTTANTWTFSTTANKDEAYVVNFNLVDGAYTIQGANGLFGTDSAEDGAIVYANKAQANNGLWTIAEYVAPVSTDYTSYIANADLKGEGGFDATGTKGIDGSGIVKVGNNAQFDFKQTIANLPAGKFKLTAQAAYRYSGSEAAEAEAIAAGTETKFAKLYATVGTTTVDTLVQNRYDGASETDYANGNGSTSVNEKFVPNSSDAVKAWFAAGKYVNEVVFNLPADGAVTIGIVKTAQPEAGDYTVIGPWTLTRIGDAEAEPEPEPEIKPGDDVTKFIVNNSFESGNLNGWTVGNSADTGVKPNSNGTYTTEGCDGDYVFNTWWQGIPITQTVKGLPNGLYELKALMANDAITAGNQPCLYLLANGQHSAAFSSPNAGTFAEGTMQFYVTDGTATIGAIGGNADGTFNEAGYYWYKADNFRLKYVEAMPNIEDVEIPEGKMSIAAANAMTAAKEAGDVVALIQAVNNAKSSIAAYAHVKEVLDFVAEEAAKTNVYTAAAKEKFDSICAATLKGYNEGTISDADANAFNAGSRLGGLLPELFLSAYTSTVEGTPYINTWSVEGNTDGSEFKTPFYEYWVGDNDALAANVITAKVEDVEPGDYEVSAWVRVRIKNGAEAPATSITLNAGNDNVTIAGTQIGTSPLYAGEYKVNATVAENGILTFNFNVAADGNVSWLSFKNVKFEKKEAQVDSTLIKAKEALQAAIAKAEALNTETRTAESVATLTAAITTAKEALAAADATVESLNSAQKAIEDAIAGLKYAPLELAEGTIYAWQAGQEGGGTAVGTDPARVAYANAGYTTISLNGKADFSSDYVTITLTDSLIEGDVIKVTAYRNKNAADKTSGFKAKFDKGGEVASTTGLEFVNIDASDASAADSNRGTEPNTCTFLVPAQAQGSKVITITRSHTGTNLFITALAITKGEIATGINTVKAGKLYDGTIYNLNGQKVNKAQKGLYIINGKRVVVK